MVRDVLNTLGIDVNRIHPQAIELFLTYLAEKTVIPELYMIFGDKTLDFLLLFAGKTISVPSYEQIQEALLDICVLAEVMEAGGSLTEILINKIKDKYNIREEEIKNRYDRAKKWFETSICQFRDVNFKN